MKFITLSGGGMLTGLSAMLELQGYYITDQQIALAMEAPYLLLRNETGYLAGRKLHRPQWLNLWLHSIGFHLSEHHLPCDEVPAFLRTQQSAMITLTVCRCSRHPVLFTGYRDKRYHFVNIKREDSPEPDTFSLSGATIRRRLAAEVAIWTLTPCTPTSADFIPLLFESLRTLDTYQDDLLATRLRQVNQTEFIAVKESLLRPLMQDLYPLSRLIDDVMLAEELRQLNHDYCHIFFREGQEMLDFRDHLSRSSIRRAIWWMRENIIDRLYALGADEATLDGLIERQKH